jgi:hypothetical protein
MLGKHLGPSLKAPKEGKMKAEKDKQKKKLSTIKEDLKTDHKLAGVETLKAYELFHCFVVGEAQMQWDKTFQEMQSKDP